MKLAASAKKRPQKNLIRAHARQRQPREPLPRARALHSVARFCRGSSPSSSASSFVNFIVATERLGCMAMSHPGAISSRCNRRISRMRLRIRFRTTALPSAFFTLMPKRSRGNPFARKKIRNVAFERRRPWRYTASYSERRTSRHSRGKFRLPSAVAPTDFSHSDAREAVAPFFAASREDFFPARTLHSRAEPVLFVPPPNMRLKRAFYQAIFSLKNARPTAPLPASTSPSETASLFDPPHSVKECSLMSFSIAHYGFEERTVLLC